MAASPVEEAVPTWKLCEASVVEKLLIPLSYPPVHPVVPIPPFCPPAAHPSRHQRGLYTVAPSMASVPVRISFWLESSPKNLTLSPSTGWTTGTSVILGKVLVASSKRLVLANSMASALRKSLARCLPRQVRTPPPKGR